MPGSLPKGKWSCEEKEVPILGTSFLDEAAQTYPGEKLMYSGKVDNYKITQFGVMCKKFPKQIHESKSQR